MLDLATHHALANPVVFSHTTPDLWLLAALAMFAEIRVGSRQLERLLTTGRPTEMLVLLNIASWFTFFVVVNSLSPTSYPAWRTVACLEGCVVLVEFQVLWLVVRASNALRPAMAKVFAVSLVANLVSIAISILPWILALAA